MKKKRKERIIPETKEEAINEAKKYIKNAKDIFSKIEIEYGRYKDIKKVREAVAIAYLAGLIAIDGYLISRGISKEKLPNDITQYYKALKEIPRNGKLTSYLITAYENLHIFAYYRGGANVDMIKAGIKSVEEIIKVLCFV